MSDELDEDQLNELISHLQADEQISLETTLESVESFQQWVSAHPGMRQMAVVENFSDIGPAILNFLRHLFGIDRNNDDDDSGAPTDEGDQK